MKTLLITLIVVITIFGSIYFIQSSFGIYSVNVYHKYTDYIDYTEHIIYYDRHKDLTFKENEKDIDYYKRDYYKEYVNERKIWSIQFLQDVVEQANKRKTKNN